MKQPNVDQQTTVEDLPASPMLIREKRNRYGTVPGLDTEELAEPDELERLVLGQEYGPVLMLPLLACVGSMRPAVTDNGQVDWGAFGTVDFERRRPVFDKVLYKVDRLREEVKDQVILLDLLNCRIQAPGKWTIIKYVRMGWVDIDDIMAEDLKHLARIYLRILRLKKEIDELEALSCKRRKRQTMALLAPLDD